MDIRKDLPMFMDDDFPALAPSPSNTAATPLPGWHNAGVPPPQVTASHPMAYYPHQIGPQTFDGTSTCWPQAVSRSYTPPTEWYTPIMNNPQQPGGGTIHAHSYMM